VAVTRSGGIDRNRRRRLARDRGPCRVSVSRQLLDERLSVLQDRRVETFGEPVVNWQEEVASLGAFILVKPEVGETRCGT
jgi:hypothetical protein